MGRNSLIIVLLTIATLETLAQGSPSTFEFVENKGQWENQIRFKGELPAGEFYLHNNGFTVALHNTDDLLRFFNRQHGHKTAAHSGNGGGGKPPQKELDNASAARSAKPGDPSNNPQTPVSYPIRSHAYEVSFIGAATEPEIVPDKMINTTANYLIGNDPSKWAVDVKTYQAVLYKDIYPNIDVRYYSEDGKLKYDLIVRPGGDVSKIQMRYRGADKLTIRNKELFVKTSVGEVKELYPYSYTFDNVNGRKETSCAFELVDANTVRFKVGSYSKNSTLIIDPTLIFSSFTGSRAGQYGFTATPGPDGSLYSGGIVFGPGFPVSPGAYQVNFGGGGRGGGVDMGIFKFNPTGTRRTYATYLGGEGNDYPHSMICDPQGNLIVMGRSYSSNFSGAQTTVGPAGSSDIVVVKLNATGTAIIGALRIGGSGADGVNVGDMQEQSGTLGQNSIMRFYGDDSRSEVNLDAAGNIYVAAQTRSSDFPVTGSAFQGALGGAQDGVIMKINPNCNAVTWASYLGGSGDDGAFVVSVNPSTNDVYVGGATASNNFPGNKSGSHQGTYQGGTADGFMAQISNDGTSLIKTTYMGTGGYDAIYGIQFDRNFYPYIMGISEGNWPVQNAAFSNPGSRQFIAKVRKDLSGFEYSTVFGSGAPRPNISPVAFLVDRCENVYISGWGGWIQTNGGRDPFNMSGTAGMPVTNDAIKRQTDNHDFYFIVIRKDAASLLYGTFFGQSGGEGEHVDGGTSRYDAQGVIYQAICANCFGNAVGNITVPYPITPGVWGPVNGTGTQNCNLGAAKIAFNFAGVASGPKAYASGVPDSSGCVPFTVTLRDTIRNAKSYIWKFGDGTPDVTTTTREVQHTYMYVGDFTVRLIAIDSTTCNITDTAYIGIRVRDNKADISFDHVKLPPCQSMLYQFDNTSTAPPGQPFKPNSFIWDFGDGSRIEPGPNSIQHSYAAAGTYNVRLILVDTNYCNAPDSLVKELRVSPLVEARFETPPTGCAPYEAVFDNTSLAGLEFIWDFGDGSPLSNEVYPTHLYTNVDTYTVTLIANDSTTCNKTDTIRKTIRVNPVPTANFTWTPIPPQTNKPTIFSNASTGGVRYDWYFGDGDSTSRTKLDTVWHQYNVTGTFNACLIVFNEFGCTDTICHDVEALIDPLLDVPTAFTPGRFGRNSYVTVAGFGIMKMSWKIYNRWGQLVFETNNRKVGWDGTYKGALQPMDVYAYTLDVEFSDGRKVRKTGDITLIR